MKTISPTTWPLCWRFTGSPPTTTSPCPQVYFPSETLYAAAGGSIEQTEKDADLEAVRRLFEVLRRFGEDDAKGFQIIVTEHANLRDDWFQSALVEKPWTKPPALVPDDWPDETEEGLAVEPS